MKLSPKNPPRHFRAGMGKDITMSDCGTLSLDPDEQITLMTEDGKELDIARKDWGYYATPSTNTRLASFGLRTALVQNSRGQLFVMIVEAGKESLFETYLAAEAQDLLCWADTDENVSDLVRKIRGRA